MATQSIGSHVTVKGNDYVITEIHGSEDLGSKFYGKFRFILCGPDNTVWSAYGKRVAHNSTLTPVEPAPVAAPVEAERCEHMSGSTGCALTTCAGTPDGVPLDRDVHVIGEPIGSEPGVWSFGREIADKVRYYAGTGAAVSAVTYSDSGHYDTPNTRQASGWTFRLNGKPVDVIAYETRTPLTGWRPAYAVYVDSEAVCLDVEGWNGRRATAAQLAFVATHALGLVDSFGMPTRATVADADASPVADTPAAPEVMPTPVADVHEHCGELAAQPCPTGEHGNVPVDATCALTHDYTVQRAHDFGDMPYIGSDRDAAIAAMRTARAEDNRHVWVSAGHPLLGNGWCAVESARVEADAIADGGAPVADDGPADVAPDGGATVAPVADVDATPAESTPAPVEPTRELSHLSVTVDRAALLDAVTHAAYAAATRTNVPVLAGARLSVADGVLAVSGFDYETSITVTVDALPDTPVADGVALVNAATLKTMVAAMPEQKATRGRPVPVGANMVTLADTGRGVRVTSGKSVRALPTMPVEDYPQLPAMPATVATVDGTEWSAQVARVTPAAGRDVTLPILTGVHVTAVDNGSAVELAALDRYRLTLGTVPASGDAIRPMIVPARFVAYVGKIAGKVAGPVGIGHGDGSVADAIIGLTFGRYTVTSRLLEGEFPNVRALMPDSSAATLTVDGATVRASVDSVATVAGKGMPVVVRPDGDTLTLTVGAPDGYDAYAEESVSGTWKGTPGFSAVAFNAAYLSAGLKAMPAGDVTLSFQDARRPVVIRSDSLPTFSYLVMPVRVGDDGTPARTPDTAKGSPVTEPTPAPVADATPEPTPVHDPSGCCTPDMCGHDHTADTAPAKTDVQPVTVPDVPVLHAATESAGQRAFEAWQAGNYAEARALLNTAESLAPSPGYLLGGSKTFDWVHARITADETAARAAADAVPIPDAPEVMPAPVADVEPTPAPADSAPVADAATVARVAEILRTGIWSSDVIRVGKGSARQPVGVDVLTLNAGRLDYRTEYIPVRDVLRTIGGAWNKGAAGFVFEPSRAQFSGGYSQSGRDALAAWLDRNAPASATAEPAPADVTAVEPVPVAAVAAVEATPARVTAEPVAEPSPAVALEPTVTPDSAAASVALHDGLPVYHLAKYTGARGIAYREAHRMVRNAVFASVKVWPDVMSVNGDRRVITVDAGAAIDAATLDGIVRAALALPDGTTLLADVPAVVSV